MSFVVDAKWLILIPLIPTLLFVGWVFWNLSREIWSERRTYGGSPVRTMGAEPPRNRAHRARRFETDEDLLFSSARPQAVAQAFPRHRQSLPPVPPNRARYQS